MARANRIGIRFSDIERAELREQMVHRGAPTEAAYLRRLIAEDSRKIRQERESK